MARDGGEGGEEGGEEEGGGVGALFLLPPPGTASNPALQVGSRIYNLALRERLSPFTDSGTKAPGNVVICPWVPRWTWPGLKPKAMGHRDEVSWPTQPRCWRGRSCPQLSPRAPSPHPPSCVSISWEKSRGPGGTGM